MAQCLNGGPHGPNKHFNVDSKALPGLLERLGLCAFTAAAHFTLVLEITASFQAKHQAER